MKLPTHQECILQLAGLSSSMLSGLWYCNGSVGDAENNPTLSTAVTILRRPKPQTNKASTPKRCRAVLNPISPEAAPETGLNPKIRLEWPLQRAPPQNLLGSGQWLSSFGVWTYTLGYRHLKAHIGLCRIRLRGFIKGSTVLSYRNADSLWRSGPSWSFTKDAAHETDQRPECKGFLVDILCKILKPPTRFEVGLQMEWTTSQGKGIRAEAEQ